MEYEKLYDSIRDVTNEVANYAGWQLMQLGENVCCPFCRSEKVSFIDETNDYYCPDCHGSFAPPAFDAKTRELLEKLKSCASELADVAHELEEHLAWDKDI